MRPQTAHRALEPKDNPNELTGAVAGRGEVYKPDGDSTGRNPEAREAASVNALKARAVDQPLASRTSSRPAVERRAERPDI